MGIVQILAQCVCKDNTKLVEKLTNQMQTMVLALVEAGNSFAGTVLACSPRNLPRLQLLLAPAHR